MKVYVSGPMTGYVDYNRPAFHHATQRLRDLGFTVVNPAELDEADGSDAVIQSHAWYLRRDIAALLTCDAIYLLPGWKHSKGATLEKQVADGCGIFEVIDPEPGLWRTFEGQPLCGDQQHVAKIGETFTCALAQGHEGDHGNEAAHAWWAAEDSWWAAEDSWWAAEDSPAEAPESDTLTEVDVEDLSAHPQWGDIGYAVDDTLPEHTLRMVTPLGVRDFEVSWHGGEMLLTPKDTKVLDDGQADYLLADLDKPRPGDEFPNVGYVRRLLGLLQRGEDDGARRSA